MSHFGEHVAPPYEPTSHLQLISFALLFNFEKVTLQILRKPITSKHVICLSEPFIP